MDKEENFALLIPFLLKKFKEIVPKALREPSLTHKINVLGVTITLLFCLIQNDWTINVQSTQTCT